jgi:colanic acid/amylovoran biosynthesis glycosyltransferase
VIVILYLLSMEIVKDQVSKPIKLVYLIGTYPELTNTFIDREITTLRQLGNFQIQIVSIRYPHTIESCSPEQKALCQETLYLIPSRWSGFNYPAFILANLYFVFSRPLVYLRTVINLLTHSRAGIKAWMMTILYFWQGVYAAYLLRKKEFDHLHVHFMDRAVLVALVVSRFLGKSYSFTAHAADIYTKATLVREKINNARFMITVSEYNKQHLLKVYPGIKADKIHILHPWVDVSQFTPFTHRPVHDHLHILSVGRLVEKKGQMDLIDACNLLQVKGIDAECWIVGEGPLHAKLKDRISYRALQEDVRLLGGLPQNQVLDLLREWADVFVLPCVIARDGDRDGIPVSLAEAMALELPVISTDIVGIRELVQPGTGILIPPHDPAALAEALSMISIQGQPAAAVLGRKGREVVEKEFNLLKGTQELAVLFYQAVGKGNVTFEEKIRYGST